MMTDDDSRGSGVVGSVTYSSTFEGIEALSAGRVLSPMKMSNITFTCEHGRFDLPTKAIVPETSSASPKPRPLHRPRFFAAAHSGQYHLPLPLWPSRGSPTHSKWNHSICSQPHHPAVSTCTRCRAQLLKEAMQPRSNHSLTVSLRHVALPRETCPEYVRFLLVHLVAAL